MNPYYEISTIHPFFSSFGLYDYESIQVNISVSKHLNIIDSIWVNIYNSLIFLRI